jgi:hypothetical protein
VTIRVAPGYMNPMLLADWGRIHRLFRTIMWLAAIVLACVVVTLAAPHASGAPDHAAAHPSGKLAPAAKAEPGALPRHQ